MTSIHRAMRWRVATTLPALLLATAADARQAPAPAPVSADAAERRAETLVGRMTRDEQLRYVFGYFPPMSKDRPADMIPSAGYVPGVPRLNIPTLRESDASLGVANQIEQRKGDVATALPASLALAASFDPDLAYRSGAMIGAEARAKTFNVLLAGGVNLTRDPWGGRTFEYLGEDPLLAGIMAGESIRGSSPTISSRPSSISRSIRRKRCEPPWTRASARRICAKATCSPSRSRSNAAGRDR